MFWFESESQLFAMSNINHKMILILTKQTIQILANLIITIDIYCIHHSRTLESSHLWMLLKYDKYIITTIKMQQNSTWFVMHSVCCRQSHLFISKSCAVVDSHNLNFLQNAWFGTYKGTNCWIICIYSCSLLDSS